MLGYLQQPLYRAITLPEEVDKRQVLISQVILLSFLGFVRYGKYCEVI